MKMPNLFWRGITITMIPMLLQLTIIAFIAHFLLTIKNEIVTESRSQEIIARAFVLNRNALETIYNLNFAFEERAPAFQVLPQMPSPSSDQLKVLTENLQKLFNVAGTDSESNQKMNELYSCHKQLADMYREAHNLTFHSNEDRGATRRKFFQRFISCARQYADATNAIVALEEKRQAQRPVLIHALLKKVWTVITLALIVSAALAAVLGYFYVVLVKRPLRVICSHGELLAKGEKLPPALEGNDEIANLDRLLHSTADALEVLQTNEKTLIENTADLICSLSENGAFLDANPYAIRMLGWTPESLIGRHLNELTVPEESFICDEKLRESRNTATISVFDLRLLTASKETIDTRWSCFWSAAQRAFFCVAHDITEMKNAERMREELLDMISHDLRSPLTSVSISLAILARGAKGELPEREKEKVESASKIIEQLIELVNDLLDFQKLSAKKIEIDATTIQLKQIIQYTIDKKQSDADAKAVTIEISGEAQTKGDKQLIAQALTAALENAINATPARSTIKIEITELGDTIQMRFIDQGEWLSDDEIAQTELSVPTQKLSSAANRSLLKFSIAKQIIEAHNGNTHSYNLKPSGYSFVMRLPK